MEDPRRKRGRREGGCGGGSGGAEMEEAEVEENVEGHKEEKEDADEEAEVEEEAHEETVEEADTGDDPVEGGSVEAAGNDQVKMPQSTGVTRGCSTTRCRLDFQRDTTHPRTLWPPHDPKKWSGSLSCRCQ